MTSERVDAQGVANIAKALQSVFKEKVTWQMQQQNSKVRTLNCFRHSLDPLHHFKAGNIIGSSSSLQSWERHSPPLEKMHRE